MKSVYMDFSPFCVKSAYVENGKLTELIIDTENTRSIAGNIYAARVKDIVKGQFAFCDIGMEKPGFLQLDDFRQAGLKDINIHSGLQLIVQVMRDPIGDKGAYLSSFLSFHGKNSVLNWRPDCSGEIKISKKITESETRCRILDMGSRLCPQGFGIIMRTSAENASEQELSEEITALHNKAQEVITRGNCTKAPALLYGDEHLYSLTLKNLLDNAPDEIIVNDSAQLEPIRSAAFNYCRFSGENIRLFEGSLPLYAAFGIENQTDKAFDSKIWLKSGAFLLIEQAQTATFIDVNTGKFKGKKSFEETAHFVNLEACEEIARQLRLKNIAGIIIIDFINAKADENNNCVKSFFETCLKNDRNPATIVDWSKLNVAQLTRKRTRLPLKETLGCTCHVCGGSGHVKSAVFTADKIYKDVKRILSDGFYDTITIKAHKNIIALLENPDFCETLIRQFGCTITVINEYSLKHGSYEILKEKAKKA